MGKVVNLAEPPVAPEADAHLAAIVDSSFDAIISKDLNSVILTWNRAAERLFGYPAEEAVGRSIRMLIPPHLESEEDDIIDRISRGERVETFETVRVRKDGTRIPVSLTVSPIRSSNGEIVGASKIARDISAAKESERRIKLLLREVNHRVKNQFAVILSMVRETLKRTADPKEFEVRMRERIMALSRSHDLLVNAEWAGADLFGLVKEHLHPFGHEDQVVLSGPLVTLQANAVQYLGIALHELGTNAAKYGALSGMEGRVSVTWQLAIDPDGRRQFSVTWEETSVPKAPEREMQHSGFGGIVLTRVTPDALSGSAVLERTPGHVRWTLSAPADAVLAVPVVDEAPDVD